MNRAKMGQIPLTANDEGGRQDYDPKSAIQGQPFVRGKEVTEVMGGLEVLDLLSRRLIGID